MNFSPFYFHIYPFGKSNVRRSSLPKAVDSYSEVYVVPVVASHIQDILLALNLSSIYFDFLSSKHLEYLIDSTLTKKTMK